MPYSKDEIDNMSDLVNFDFDEFETEAEIDSAEKFNIEIKFKVSHETNERWKELKDRIETIGGFSSDSKVFEFAVIEALNIPKECLGLS